MAKTGWQNRWCFHFSELITDRIHAEERISNLNRTLTVRSEVNQAIARVHHIPDLYKAICEIAVEKGGFRMAWVGLSDDHNRKIIPATHAGTVDNYLEKLNIVLDGSPSGKGATATAFRSGNHVVINDIEHDAYVPPWREDALRLGYRASASFPLKIAGKVRGVFNLYSTEPNFFNADELRLLDEMAGDIGFAMEFAQQEDQRVLAEEMMQRYLWRLEVLHEIDQSIIQADSLPSVIATALKYIRQIIPCQRAMVMLIDESTHEGVIFAVDLDGDTTLNAGTRIPIQPDTFEAYGTAHIRSIDDFATLQVTSPMEQQLMGEGIRSAFDVLLMDQSKPMGSLALFSSTLDFFSAEYREIAEQVAGQLAIAVRQMRFVEEIRQSEALYRLLTENMADVVWMLDAQTLHFTYVSPSVKQMRGYTPEEVMEMQLYEAMTAESLEMIAYGLAERLEGFLKGDPESIAQSYEIEQLCKDGSTVWTEVVTALLQETPETVQVLGVSRNIAQRKKIETELRQNEARYRSVIEDQTDIICRYDADFRLTFVNGAYSMNYGIPPEQLIGIIFLDFIPENQREEAVASIRALSVSNPVSVSEHQSVMPDKSLRWFQWTDRALFDDDGHIIEYQGVGHDIAERKLFEATREQYTRQVEELGHFLQTTLDAFPANTVVLNKDGEIITVNAHWKHFAADNDAPQGTYYLGENYLRVCENAVGLKAEEAKLAAEGIRAVIEGSQGNFYVEYPCHSPTEQRWFVLRITPFDEPAPRRVVLAHINITERKQAEAALQVAYDQMEQRVTERTAELKTAKERVEAILNHSVDGILLVQTDMRIQQGNAAFNRLFACPIDAYFDQPLTALVAEEDHILLTQALESALNNPHGKTLEIRARRHDGSYFDAEMSIGYIKNDGVVCTIGDITERKAQERELRYHASVQASITDAVFTTDLEFRIQSWNKAAENIYGWQADEVIGQFVGEVLQTNNSSNEERIAIRETFLKQGYWYSEFIQRHKDGHQIYIQGSTTLFKDESGNTIGTVSVNQDITDRKKVETELKRREEQYRTLAKNLPGTTVFMFDHDLRYFLVDGEAPALPKEYMEGKTLQEVFSGEALAKLLPAYQAALRGEATRTERRGENGRIYDGQFVPIREEDGSVAAGLLVVRDITVEREAEQRLTANEARFRLILNNVRDYAIMTLMPDGAVASWGPGAEQIKGYTEAEILGQNMSLFYTPEDRAIKEPERILEIARKEGHFVGEGWRMRKDGTRFWASVNITALYNQENRLIGYTKISHDLTDHKRAEMALQDALDKEQEVSELKSQFISTASHEFRTPLATILASTETLGAYRRKMSDEQIEQRLDKIRGQVAHLKIIMDDVLQLARMQARRVEFSPIIDNFDAFCRDSVDEFQSHPSVKHQIIYTCQENLPQVAFDPKLMRHVINNLIENALKYSPGKAAITIDLHAEGEEVLLTVSDEGIGIPEEDLKHLFEPFHRAGNVETIPGTGLGLSITKESIELHSGKITVRTKVNEGTAFTIHLPYVSPTKAEPQR